MADFVFKRGYDIPIDGAPEREIVDAPVPQTVAVTPTEFRGIKPKLLVRAGDQVEVGTPLFYAKRDERQVFTSPVSGRVSELAGVNRGAKRVLESIIIENDGENKGLSFDSVSADAIASLSRDDVMERLLKSGMLALFRERPFDYVAVAEHTPRDIFVSTMDTSPLSADPNLQVQGNESYFQAGLDVAAKLTTGKVHLSTDGSRRDLSSAFTSARNVEHHKFSGPHPAGLVGVHIHHIAPISGKNDIVWYITVQGLITLGKLFIDGKINPEIVVAVSGTSSTNRRYFRTMMGASVDSIVQRNTVDEPIRYVTGNVLTGRKVPANGFISYYESTLTLLPESTGSEFVGWMRPGHDKPSVFGTFVSKFMKGKKFRMDTRLLGGVRAFVATGVYEKVLPMQIYPMFLFKSIMIEDIEEMEGLGIYELTEEEVALCEYVCPSKISIQQIVRDGLELMAREA